MKISVIACVYAYVYVHVLFYALIALFSIMHPVSCVVSDFAYRRICWAKDQQVL